MKKQKENPIKMELTVTCNTKEEFRKFVEDFGQFVSKDQKEVLDVLMKEQFEEKEEVFNPKKGDILLSYVGSDDWSNAIFRYDGGSHSDTDGDKWLHADVSLSYSGNLMKPYLIVRGEDQEYLAENCRFATEEERNLFYAKVGGRPPKEEKESPKTPSLVHVVGSDSGCTNVFFPVPTILTESKMMENKVKKGWVFQTEEECQAVCDKLNEAIKNIK